MRPVDLDETPLAAEPAAAYVRRLALEKARARSEPGELILAADTVVSVDGELLGKPVDSADARSMLQRLSGRGHEVLTGVAVYDPDRGRLDAEVESTQVHFAELTEAELDWYIASGEPMDKAGAYAVQGLAALFVLRLEGNYSNVVGLPLPTVYRLLAAAGYTLI